jgi:alpha-D-ribose 1-methylphosphonate 5-triphosphate diphosphatase
MNFDLSEDQAMLKAAVERFVADSYGGDLEARRKARITKAGFSAAHWARLAETGVLALPVSAGHGVTVAEFPTTQEAAAANRTAGIANMMGAPNLVRGGSHSGNVAAKELAEAGLLDILSSDYVPAALLLGAVMLGDIWGDMARGMATVTSAPARAARLADRGELAVGLWADLLRFRRLENGTPLVRGVWSKGLRVG